MIDRIPKKYQERVKAISQEGDLTDDCKYVIHFADGWAWDDYKTLPVSSIKEAVEKIRDARRDNEYNE